MPMTADLRATLNGLADALDLALPKYMIPTLFIPFKYFPLISSAKLDRVNLRQLTGNFSTEQWNEFALLDGTQKRGPATPMEVRLQKIWAIILNIPAEKIGRNDSFLRIGGASISAIRLVSLARDAGIDLDVGQVFKDSRLCYLTSEATDIDAALSDEIRPFSLLSESVKAHVLDPSHQEKFGLSKKDVIEDAFPCTKLQEGLMAIAARQQGSYFAKHLFKPPSHVDMHRSKSAWEQTVAACSNLRTKIILVDNSPIQIQIQEGLAWEE